MIDMKVNVGTSWNCTWPLASVQLVFTECMLLVIGLLLCANIPYSKPLPNWVLGMRERALKASKTCLVSHTPQ